MTSLGEHLVVRLDDGSTVYVERTDVLNLLRAADAQYDSSRGGTTMRSVEASMKITELQDEVRISLMQCSALKQAVCAALCGICGEHIADEDWAVDGTNTLVHTLCEEKEETS